MSLPMAHFTRSRRATRGGVAALLMLAIAALASACATARAMPGSGGDPGSRLLEGADALEEGRFGEAYRTLRALAARCESGEQGREAVLLLSTGELDPRNPARSPAASAQLAARYLQAPSIPVTSLVVAESLYLLALDLGASSVQDPFGPISTVSGAVESGGVAGAAAGGAAGSEGRWSVAPRFESCGSDSAPQQIRDLPSLPGPSLSDSVGSLVDRRDALRATADSLSSELERVRGLLRSGPARPDSTPRRP